ncbi:MAG: HipA domain-containing protein [Chitinophagales bacterium]|nr:HipA domain-containing protein [Chitinophagales bacterium]HMU99372.1 HipA domain-containing protein [Chitinophagales bacterium]HMY43733.1 HipA domain-containing protein [Chitinophagales bacterium]HMZ95224.1 HipA domain-containing protein [Chitinophagales bacterium]HNO47246.1 HipA domain-containing protein [Chitinophagales bacterium]
MKSNNCLYCYNSLNEDEQDFHSSCAKKIFGTTVPPIIEFNFKQLEELAKQIIIKSIAVTGVQPKLSLEIKKHKNELPRLTIVGLHGNYILKPPSTEYKELPQNEDVTMHLASLVKIKTAQHCLIRLHSGELAYITKRFDRNKKEKIAVEDFCQLTENLTEHKYRSSIEKVAKATQKFTTNKGLETLRLFELVLFCYLTGNADMHLKNFALVENNLGEFELSPAYDLLSTSLVITNDKEETALNINGKKSKLKKKDFDTLAISMNINTKVLESIYTKFEKVLPYWIDFIKQSFLSKAMQKKYIELITNKHQNLFQ